MFCFIYDYQTLIAGILALFAALLTIWKMHDIETTKRRKKNKAAKAMLSHGLSSICDFTEQTAEWLNKLYLLNKEQINNNATLKAYYANSLLPELPQLPHHTFQWISDAIEYSDNIEAEKSINKLAEQLQVHNSRLGSIKQMINELSSVKINEWINIYITDAMDTHVRASHLFDYARGTKKIIYKEKLEISRGLFFEIWKNNPELKQMIEGHNASITNK